MMKKFFARRFGRYLFVMILPTLLVFIISLYITNKQLDQELEYQAKNTLSSVNLNLDFVISTAIYQNDLLTTNTGTLLALKKLMAGGNTIEYGEAIYLRNIQTMLRTITDSYPYISSVYLYLDGYDNMMASDNGVVKIEEFPDNTWKNMYESMPEDKENYVGKRLITSGKYDPPREVISFYQRMLLFDGVIVMNIDTEGYKQRMAGIFPSSYESLFFVNENGEILLSWSDNLLEEYMETRLTPGWVEREMQNNSRWIRHNQRRYLFHVEENSQYRIHLISLLSNQAKREQIESLSGIFIVILLTNLIFVMFLAYTTTERNFRQIRYMIHVFDDAENGIYPEGPQKKMQDEYDIIMNNIIYIFLNTVQLNTELQEKKYETEREKMAALQMQINPHFLHNTLQSLEFEILKLEDKGKDAGRMLRNLSDILKYSLEDPISLVPLKEEISYLKRYVEIQKYRFGEVFIVYYEIFEEAYDARVFRLLLQPLIENSIQHGIRNNHGGGYIKIKVFLRNERIYFHVVDNGSGMSREQLLNLRGSILKKKDAQIGVANVNSRLVLRYGEDSRLFILSKMGMGCCVSFSLPYETASETLLITNNEYKS